MNSYELYRLTNKRLDNLIDLAPNHEPGLVAIQARAVERLAWMQGFMEFLGNPHLEVPVIHVTGTSGKGSTATAIASILQAAGLRTLLHTSPYLQVSTEKIQFDGRLISSTDLAALADEVIAAADGYDREHLTYGEAWMAIVMLAMRRFKPDVAIIEVGAGGRFDLSNVVQPDVAVITSVGIDHVESLGSSIEEIAWHKAGIIKSGSSVVHSVVQPEAIAQINQEAALVGVAGIEQITELQIGITQGSSGTVYWTDAHSGFLLTNGIGGSIQAVNGAVAVAAARAFKPDIAIGAIDRGLKSNRIPARFERMPGPGTVILDGAHNEQKMSSLIRDLQMMPRPTIGVVGFLASKRFNEMIAMLAPHLDQIVVSSPDVIGKPALLPAEMLGILNGMTDAPVIAADSPVHAVELARLAAREHGTVIVTGSLYLCGEAREIWYSGDDIVVQQTQWPER